MGMLGRAGSFWGIPGARCLSAGRGHTQSGSVSMLGEALSSWIRSCPIPWIAIRDVGQLYWTHGRVSSGENDRQEMNVPISPAAGPCLPPLNINHRLQAPLTSRKGVQRRAFRVQRRLSW